jgi:hypothetical protein
LRINLENDSENGIAKPHYLFPMKTPIDPFQAGAPVQPSSRPVRTSSRALWLRGSAGVLLIVPFALVGCGNHSGTAESAIKAKADSGLVLSHANEMGPIQYDEVSFPGEDLPGVALRGGVFHEDEVTDDLRKGPWFGLS